LRRDSAKLRCVLLFDHGGAAFSTIYILLCCGFFFVEKEALEDFCFA